LLLPSASDTEAALLQRVERIETRLDMSIPASDEISASAPAVPRKQFVRKSEAAPQPAPSAQAPAPARAPEPSPEPTPVPAREPDPVPEPPREASKPVEPEPVPPPLPPPPPVRPPAAPVVEAPATTPAAAVATGEPSAAAVRSMWTTVREKVRERSRTTEVMLAGAIVRAVEGDTLLLSHESAPLAKRLSEQRNADVIREALKDALGVNWKIRCDPGTAPASAAAPAREPQRGPAEPPPPPDIDDEESMLAEAGNSDPAAPRRDPEEAALELLQNELGARRIDG
ncbi:MAG: DNA polymerase III subunit gamma/tau, partial [Mycolicibacterium sp.]